MLSHLARWEDSQRSLVAAQAIDFNPDTEAVSGKVAIIEAEKVQQRIADEVGEG